MKPVFKKLIVLFSVILGVFVLWRIFNVHSCYHFDSYMLKENEKSATCFEDGSYDGIWICSKCYSWYKTTRGVTPITHKTENGACIDCGEAESSKCLELYEIQYSIQSSKYDFLHYTGVYGYAVKRVDIGATSNITVSTFNNRAVREIGSKAFKDCRILKKLTIGNNVREIAADAFIGCENLNNIEVAEHNNSFISIDGNLYSKDGKTLLLYAKGKKEKTVTIPDGVTAIGDYAFQGCSELTSVVIPNSLKSIGNKAFSDCVNLSGIELPNGLTDIGWAAFSHTAITSVELPCSLKSVDGAFINCEKLTEVTFGDGTKVIGEGMFYNCTALKNISVPDSVESIGGKAFKDTGYYKNAENWENGVLYIGKHLIKARTFISGKYTVKDGTVSIADEAFFRCRYLTKIVIPKSVKYTGQDAFYGCDELG